ncbi:cobalamin-dependent protein [Roseivivax sp. CAU 1753]
MRRKVVCVEISVNQNVLPLVSGYLQAYACKDTSLANACEFVHVTAQIHEPRHDLLRRLVDQSGDVYAFSCYVWNMRLVRFLANGIASARPGATVLLGGPQVDGHGADYLRPECENMVVGNGEGEGIFRDLLMTLEAGDDLTASPGLTLFRDGHLMDTAAATPLRDINEIPSPYLGGFFQGEYTSTVFETNRGCPYSCTFCYWGKGDDNSLRKFDENRLREEIDWIARNAICYIHLGDANWGILKRDVDLSRHIVDCKERYGMPGLITFSAAKAKIDRSAEIASIFHDADIISAQAIGVQSTSEAVLGSIRRRNIKLADLQRTSELLTDRGISTFVELIWPLPSETLASFEASLTAMCASGVTSVIVYPAMLLHATPMEAQVDEFRLETIDTDDDVSELQLIVSTRDVSRAENDDGIWLVFAVYCLYNSRALRRLGKYLHDSGKTSWADLFRSFEAFCRSENWDISAYWDSVVRAKTHSEHDVLGRLIHMILHDKRSEFLRMLARFARSQDWWQDKEARVLFEIDCIGVPFVYSNTDFAPESLADIGLEHLAIRETGDRTIRVSVDRQDRGLAARAVFGDERAFSGTFDIDYKAEHFPFMAAKPMRENYTYVYGIIHRASVIAPTWKEADGPSGRAFEMSGHGQAVD